MKKVIFGMMLVSSISFATEYTCELNNRQPTLDGYSDNKVVVTATVGEPGKVADKASAILPNGKIATARIQSGMYGSGTTSFELIVSNPDYSLRLYFISVVVDLPVNARVLAGDDNPYYAKDSYEMKCKKN